MSLDMCVKKATVTVGMDTRYGQKCDECNVINMIYPDSSKTRGEFLVFFLTEEDRGKLVALVRDG
jgi:hypothetical protein